MQMCMVLGQVTVANLDHLDSMAILKVGLGGVIAEGLSSMT